MRAKIKDEVGFQSTGAGLEKEKGQVVGEVAGLSQMSVTPHFELVKEHPPYSGSVT